METNEEKQSGLRVKCLITGKPGYFSATLLQEKLKSYNTLEEVGKHYICRDAGKLLRDGKSQTETRIALGLPIDGYVEVDQHIIEKI